MGPRRSADALARAQRRKLDFFADRLGVRDRRVLDVGCGWGALLDRFVGLHGAARRQPGRYDAGLD